MRVVRVVMSCHQSTGTGHTLQTGLTKLTQSIDRVKDSIPIPSMSICAVLAQVFKTWHHPSLFQMTGSWSKLARKRMLKTMISMMLKKLNQMTATKQSPIQLLPTLTRSPHASVSSVDFSIG